MNPVKALTTPEYLFRPSQMLVRLKRSLRPSTQPVEDVKLPWGVTVAVRPHEVIGARLWYYGIFDMEVAEVIWRLLDRGETALDIGANIGVMTTLMCARIGPEGSVTAFEPHPKVFEDLERHVANLPREGSCKPLLRRAALSDRPGKGLLAEGPDWEVNRGKAKLVERPGQSPNKHSVELVTLDDTFSALTKCHLCKIDVEGHELSVLKGAHSLLSQGRIRDIIFEDLGEYPTGVQNLLRGYGYRLFSVHKRLFGPEIVTLDRQPKFAAGIEGANFLATLEEERARRRCVAKGWQVLSRKTFRAAGLRSTATLIMS